MTDEETIERVGLAIERATHLPWDGPYGLFDYSSYGWKDEPHHVRDFRDPKSDTWGHAVFTSSDPVAARAEYERLTRAFVAEAAIAAYRSATDPRGSR